MITGRLSPPDGIELGTVSTAWLRAELIRSHRWRTVAFPMALALAIATAVTSAALWLSRAVDGSVAGADLLISLPWLVILAAIRVLQARTIQTPPLIADDELQLARALITSIAIRRLLTLQLLVIGVACCAMLDYLALVVDGFPWCSVCCRCTR